jgi:hypothetical protein
MSETSHNQDARVVYVIEELIDGEWVPAGCDPVKDDIELEVQEIRENDGRNEVRMVEYIPRFEIVYRTPQGDPGDR